MAARTAPTAVRRVGHSPTTGIASSSAVNGSNAVKAEVRVAPRIAMARV